MKSMFQLFAAAVIGAATLTACGGHYKKPETVVAAQPDYKVTEVLTGTGTVANSGDLVTIIYTGYLYDSTKADGKGAKFETSADIGATAPPFTLGIGRVPTGWDQTIVGMRVGGKRTAVLPASLAYGAATRAATGSYPALAANTPLVYDFELVNVSSLPGPTVVPPPTVTTIQDTLTGTGTEVTAGKTAYVRYTGWVYDGSRTNLKGAQFDSNVDQSPAKDLLAVVIDGGSVITGFNTGVKGMKVGGKRTVTIPPSDGYGSVAQTRIPANSTLIFEIELTDVK